MGIVETHSIEVNTFQLMYREPKIAHFFDNLFFILRIDYDWKIVRRWKIKLTPVKSYTLLLQYKSKETPQLIGLFSPNLVITNFMQCFLYGPIG